jgi:hypothetical protein
MSSPTVLTWESEERIQQARASNSREAALHLAVLRDMCDRVNDRRRRLKARGESVAEFPFEYDEIAARVNRLLRVDRGFEGLELARAAVRNARYPQAELIDRQFFASEAKEEARSRESTRRAAEQLVQSFRAYDVRRVVASSPPAMQTEIERELAAIAACAPNDDLPALAEQVRRTLTAMAPVQVLAALRAHRLTLEERALTKRTNDVTARLIEEQRATFRTEVDALLALARSELTMVEQERERAFADELERLGADALQLGPERFHERFEDVRRRITAERDRVAMIALVQTVLERHGYEHFEPMETITPEHIRGRVRTMYFSDGQDGERFVELAFADEAMLAIEVVRGPEAGDSSDAERDLLAQRRLCDAVMQIEKNADETVQLTVVHHGPVGRAVSARAAVRRRGTRTAAAPERAIEQ